MEIMLLEQQQFFKPLRYYQDMDPETNGNAATYITAAAMQNIVRAHVNLHQMWTSHSHSPPTSTSSSHSPAEIQAAAFAASNGGAVPFAPPLTRLPAVPLHLWPASNSASAALPWSSIQQPIGLLRTQPPPPPTLSSRNNCTSPIPSDLRLPKSPKFPSASHLQSNRFSPYQNVHKKSAATIDMRRN